MMIIKIVGASFTMRKYLADLVLVSRSKSLRQTTIAICTADKRTTINNFPWSHPSENAFVKTISQTPNSQEAIIAGTMIARNKRRSIILKVSDISEPAGASA